MRLLQQLQQSPNQQFLPKIHLNLYDSPICKELATQVSTERYLRFLSSTPTQKAIEVHVCEDDYTAWLSLDDLEHLEATPTEYQAKQVFRDEIERQLPNIVAFTQSAMKQPNHYLWGGTVAPNYDCSGLIQAAYAHAGIWLPRDSYQQADFTQAVAMEELQLGDLIFFASETKVNHVALYLGDGYYIHSSGIEFGRNGIGIDILSPEGDAVSRTYFQQLWGTGRVMSSYTPMNNQ